MKDVEQGNPDLVSSAVYGHTYEERNITLLKVTHILSGLETKSFRGVFLTVMSDAEMHVTAKL